LGGCAKPLPGFPRAFLFSFHQNAAGYADALTALLLARQRGLGAYAVPNARAKLLGTGAGFLF
jgi:hypothetical protein